jgi:glycosyltransferase involved in cell wall biosynthesis
VNPNARGAANGAALFFGVITEEYPRNRRLRQFLARELAMDSVVLPVDDDPGYLRKGFGLLRRALRSPRGTYGLIVVPEFALKYAPIAWLVAKYQGAPLLVDWFVGLYETRVGDWGREPNLRAKAGLLLDKAAARLASILVTDTQVRAAMLKLEYGAKDAAVALPVGAPDWARPQERPRSDSLEILYYGSYQPLHGLDAFIDALAKVPDKSRINLTLIGSGNTRPAVERSLVRLGLIQHCSFIDAVPEAELGSYIAAADVVLGIFGDSKKASSVIANKVWQGLACNRVVLTRSNPALSELREIAGPLLVEVDSVPAVTGLIEKWLQSPDSLRSVTVPDIDAGLESYVQSKYELLRLELLRNGLS